MSLKRIAFNGRDIDHMSRAELHAALGEAVQALECHRAAVTTTVGLDNQHEAAESARRHAGDLAKSIVGGAEADMAACDAAQCRDAIARMVNRQRFDFAGDVCAVMERGKTWARTLSASLGDVARHEAIDLLTKDIAEQLDRLR